MPSARTKDIALLACIMAIPLALSAFFFMGQSLRLDEAQSLWQTSRSVPAIFKQVGSDVHVPFYHLLLHFWQIYMGGTIWSARLLSLIFYVLSIPALYLLGSVSFGRRIGLYAALLFALSPFMNWYGNEIRMYTLFTLLTILNQYFFVRIWKSGDTSSPDEERRQGHVWAGYILTAVFGIFSHYFFFLNLLAQTIFYFVRRKTFPVGSLRKFLFSAGVVVAAFVPWVLYVWRLGTAGFQEPLLTPPTTVNLFSTFAQFLFGFQNDNINTFFLALWPLVVILALLGLRRTQRVVPETLYFLVTILVSFAAAFVVSISVAPVFVSRYLIFTIPSFYLLLGSLFVTYQPRMAAVMQRSLAVLMVAMLVVEVFSATTPVKENYEQATQYLSTHATPQDVIVLSAPFTLYPVQYYYRGASPLMTLPLWDRYDFGPIPPFVEGNLPSEVKTAVGSSQNVYLLLSYNQGYEKTISDYFNSHYQLIDQQHFSDDMNLYVYKLRYDTNKTAETATSSTARRN
jgi:mannosyltransferase